jgi:hypothetical protein
MADSRPADNRRGPRSRTYAKVLVEGAGTLGYLRDLSREGCQLALLAPLAADSGETLTIRILPEPDTGVQEFRMTLEVRWSRTSSPYFLVGGVSRAVGASAESGPLEQLLHYYAG